MPSTVNEATHGFDYAAYGCEDGKCFYAGSRKAEENRRRLVLKAARQLRGHADDTAAYLDGVEKGMKIAGATEATARRLRYEVAAVITSYSLTVAVEMPSAVKEVPSKRVIAHEYMNAKTLEAQGSWLALVNTARDMRSAAANRERLEQGLAPQMGRGNHGVRKFQDSKFDKLREQLIERTASNQALDLLDAAIIAVANAFSTIASDDIETLREAEKKIHDKVDARYRDVSVVPSMEKQRSPLRA